MEKDPKNSEEEKDESSEEGGKSIKLWLQENMRMLISVAIVIAIAGGIYAYSKRTQPPAVPNESTVTTEQGEGKISVIGGEETAKETQPAAEEKTAPSVQSSEQASTTPTETSKETDSSFLETARKGDSVTKLARRALANYLEKNPDTSLTAEHKIYIEDFLRRQVKNGTLRVGESREFSKDAIAKAIEKSKTLNERQLKNLEKYSKRVPELR